MKIVSTGRSQNFTDLEIPVEFVVLHSTATTLERTLEIFHDPRSEASAHLVIAVDGTVHEVVPCLDGAPRRAWHAGKSRLEVGASGARAVIEGFNDRSIGIELVNLNGNLYPFSEAQYNALFAVIARLKALYPGLGHPGAIVGHEQIAGFRGKCDPGLRFEWGRLYGVCYPNQGAPERPPVCPVELAERMGSLVKAVGAQVNPDTGEVALPEGVSPAFFEHLSSLVEKALSLR
jgi:N-acetylmuramoyl-L-alanine amidase